MVHGLARWRSAVVVVSIVVVGICVGVALPDGAEVGDRPSLEDGSGPYVDAIGDAREGRSSASMDIMFVAVATTAETVSFRVTFRGLPLQTDEHGVSVAIDTHSALGPPRGPWEAPYGAWIDYQLTVRGPQTTGELHQGPALLDRGVEPWSAPRRVPVVVDRGTVTVDLSPTDLGLRGALRCFHFVVGSDRYGGYGEDVMVHMGVDTAPDWAIGDTRNRPYYACIPVSAPRDL